MRDMDPTLPVVVSETMEMHVEDSLLAIETAATALGALSLAGLGLAGIGLHAVIAFAVARRSRELGIRMALGARAVQVVRLVAREVARLIAAGIAAGFAFAWLAVLALRALAADLSAAPHLEVAGPRPDTSLFVAVAVVIVIAGLAAAFFPARRAAKADPSVALRHT
jgi:ABC-type antimicrobial peptide transport system permease subunit